MYRRTVYCRFCGQSGHNKRGCPNLSPEMKAHYESGGGARKCSYCAEKGHTKTTCSIRKERMGEYIKINSVYRKEVLDRLVEIGCGIGALVWESSWAVTRTSGKGDDGLAHVPENVDNLTLNRLFLVEGFEWDRVQQKRTNLRFIRARQLITNYVNIFRPPLRNDDGAYAVLNVIGKGAQSSTIINSVPPNWLDGTSGIEDFF